MANNIINSVNNIEGEVAKITNQVREINKEILKASENARNFSSVFSKSKTPSGVNEALDKSIQNNTLLESLIKEREATERKYISTLAKKILIQDKNTKQLAKENDSLKILRQEQRRQIRAMSQTANAYDKLSAKNNILIKRYQDLAVRQEKGIKLTEREERRLKRLGDVINKNQTILKGVDANVGRFSRNVGNYASSWNGLNNAVNQLTREAPAFANSLQTGFLAISNNLPMLFDEIQKIIEQNRILRKEGQPTKSIFKQLAGSVLSLQVLLSVGVTLLTLYGKQLVELASNAIRGSKAINEAAVSKKALNEASKEGVKQAVNEIAQLQLLFQVSKDKTKSDETRRKAVDKLIESSNGLVKEQDRLNILNGEALDVETKLIKALLNKAILQQLQTKIAEKLNGVLNAQIGLDKQREAAALNLNEIERQALKVLNQGLNLENRVFTSRNKFGLPITRALTEEEIKRVQTAKELINQGKKLNFNSSDRKNIDSEILNLTNKQNKSQQEANAIIKSALKLVTDYTLELDNNTNSSDKNTKSTEKRTEALLLQEKILKNINDISKDSEVSFSLSGDFKAPKLNTDELNQSLEEINEKVAQDLLAAFDKQLLDEALNDMTKSIESFTGINADVLGNFIDTLDDVFKNGFENIGDIAKSTFETVGEVANSFFSGNIEGINQQIEANQEYYDNVLSNENLSDEARKKAEKDREDREKKLLEKRRKEQQKQAEINKALNVFNIINNTAQGVTAALATANIPLSVLIGSLGAAQLALALSTPIPKFAEGGVMDHDGLMQINDHPSGRLEVVERDGKFMMTTKKDAIVQGKKGDIIHKDASKVFENKTDEQIINNLDTYVIAANLSSNMAAIYKAENKRTINHYKLQTDRVVRAINKKKSNFVVNNSNNIDLNYLRYSNF